MTFINPKTDFAFKKIFGMESSKSILMSFLNALIYNGNPTIKDLQIINPYQGGKVASLKESYLDVKAVLDTGTIVIIEMQVLYVKAFQKRVLYNTAKAYSNQLKFGESYTHLQDVISLSITDFTVFKEHDKVISKFSFKEDEDLWHYDATPEMRLIFVELPKFKKSLNELETITDKWIYFLKEAGSLEIMPPSLEVEPEIKEAFSIANLINLTPEELDESENQIRFMFDQQNFVKDAVEKGIEEGLEKAVEKAVAEVREKTVAEVREKTVAEVREKTVEATKQELVMRQLTRRCGEIDESIREQIMALSLAQIDKLTDDLLDFNNRSDLINWLSANPH